MKSNNRSFGLTVLLVALCAMVSPLRAQLIYTFDNSPIAPFTAMKADTAFVNNTLLNLGTFTPTPDFDGQIHSFVFGGLTFNNIPNLDPNSPSDLQVGPGFTYDGLFLAKDSADVNNIGAESSLLGAGNQVLYAGYGAGSNQTFHIKANSLTDLIFWHQDTSTDNVKYTMDDILHFTTFTAVDVAANFRYYIFGIDDRGTSLQDFDDAVFGLRVNIEPVGLVEVPEPSTYGLIAAAGMLALVAYRRTKAKAQAVA